MVTASGQEFDTVAMATAVHRMAALDAGATHYEFVADQPEFERLLEMIGASQFVCRSVHDRPRKPSPSALLQMAAAAAVAWRPAGHAPYPQAAAD